MCRGHGGRRCPNDTSEARRLRRKAAALRKTGTTGGNEIVLGDTIVSVGGAQLEELKVKATVLRKQIYDTPDDATVDELREHDACMEKAVSELGVELGLVAEKLTGLTDEEFSKHVDDTMSTLTADLDARNYASRELLYETSERRDEIFGKYNLPYESSYEHYKTIEEIEKLFSDETKNQITDEEWDELRTYVNSVVTQNLLTKEYYDAMGIKSNLYLERNQKLKEAYHTVIQSIRPVGGSTVFNSKSSVFVTELVENTVNKHYPTEWLETHNKQNGDDVILGSNDTRPYYDSGAFSDDETGDEYYNVKSDARFTFVNRNSFLAKQIVEAFSDVAPVTSFTYDNLGDSITHVRFSFSVGEEIYDQDKHGDTPPSEENGWVFRVTANSLVHPECPTLDTVDRINFVTTKQWVREVPTNAKKFKKLNVYSEKSAKLVEEKIKINANEATTYHEFGHRMEEVLPKNVLPRLQKSFLMRRSGKTEANCYENMNHIRGEEFSHNGGFVDTYMGRDYFDNKNFEVFTTGMEALYGKHYGGLVGNSAVWHNKDYDHRGFVLGVLATL